MTPIYLDFNATTPVAPGVIDVMHRVLRDVHGNPSSSHSPGELARREVQRARSCVAAALGARPDQIVFTGGGSEANNLALKGMADGRDGGGIITQLTEHPSVLEPLRFLESRGFRITWLPVDGTGLVNPDDVASAIDGSTILVSIQHANNETGTIQPIEEISRLATARGVPVHVDAAQSVGKIPVNVGELGVQLLSVAGHKLYGPKGVGVLFIGDDMKPTPLVHGADHERGFRAGTEALHQLAGLGEACRLASEELDSFAATVVRLRDSLHDALRDAVPDLLLHGHPSRRLPNTLNVGFPNVVGAELLAAAPKVAASTGSACHAGDVRLSPVLEAMDVSSAGGRGAIRLSLGRGLTWDDVVTAGAALVEAYRKVRRT